MAFDAELAPVVRNYPLNRDALAVARRALIETLAEGGISIVNPTVVTEAVLRAYLPLDREAKISGRKRRLSDNTHALAAMQVGDVIHLPIAVQTARGRMNSVRRFSGEPQRSWGCRATPQGLRIERLPDGTDPQERRDALSPITLELADMQVEECRLSTVLGVSRPPNAMSTNHKMKARKMLGCIDADWTTYSTNKGVRLTRVK